MAEVVPISDRALLERHRKGDRDAFAQLMNHYANSVYGYLSRCGVRPADRDDLFQDVFEKVHRASQKGMPTGPVRPWFFTILVNTVRDSFRRKKVRSVVKLDTDAGGRAPDSTQAPADRAVEQREMAAFLDGELEKLPLPQREALLLCTVEGLSMDEASEALGAPVNTIKTRVRRARMSLAEAMQRRSVVAAREEAG